jgi:hypothetical protein
LKGSFQKDFCITQPLQAPAHFLIIYPMFELIAIALFQLAALTTPSTNAVGSSGWGHDVVAPATTESVGSSGWGHDFTSSSTTTTETPTAVGSSGWGHDKN